MQNRQLSRLLQAPRRLCREQLPGVSTTANASPAAKGASGAQLDEQVDEAIDAQEYKELPDREVVAQVVPQESAARLANSDGDVATTGEAMACAQRIRAIAALADDLMQRAHVPFQFLRLS